MRIYTCYHCESGDHGKCELTKHAPPGVCGGSRCICPCEGDPDHEKNWFKKAQESAMRQLKMVLDNEKRIIVQTNPQEKLAQLVKKVSLELNWERGAVCAHDCLMQWSKGRLEETMQAWERHLDEVKNNLPHTDTSRNGAWVPAIPL
jgi:hypothetical protein